jgi:sodium transport system ATP-binding protein
MDSVSNGSSTPRPSAALTAGSPDLACTTRARLVIEVEGLHKCFRTRQGVVRAVDGVSFRAEDGLITGLLGPNGAGKTTTLRMLYTLMRPDAGRILIDGIDPGLQPAAARARLGVLPDARGIYKRLSARENIAYFGQLQGLEARAIDSRIERLVEALGMQDFIDRRAEGFSQGQRTKTAIARALVHDPRNVLLDEPTNGLDVMTTRSLRAFLLDLKAAGRCVLLSSHIMQEVGNLCDRIVVIARGRVVAAGTPDELRLATGCDSLEDAFVRVIGSDEGLLA